MLSELIYLKTLHPRSRQQGGIEVASVQARLPE